MEINCKFRTFSVNRIDIYFCIIVEANITEKDHVIKKFKGNHEEGKNDNDVKYISFQNTKVNYFPRGLEKHFPNLTQVVFHYCGIKEISRNDLKGLEGLVFLFLINCQLTSLPDDLLTEMPNLRIVSFGYNKIEFASSNLLKPLIGRENVRVDLQGNKTIDACYSPEGSLKSLEDLMKLIDEKCIKPTFVSDPVDSDPKTKEMWTSGKLSDLTIVAGGKEFKVHKTILGMRSEVFAQMFDEDQLEATEIKIPGFSSKSVEALLKFIYTNEISEDGNAKENFEIADKFKIAAMKKICEKIICVQVDDSAEEIFWFAYRRSSQLLMEKAFHLIAEKFPELPIKILEDPEKLKKLIDALQELDELFNEK